MKYFISPDVVMLYERALLSFSEFSLAIKASLALWSASTFFIIVLFVGGDVIAGALDNCKAGSFGLVPIDN